MSSASAYLARTSKINVRGRWKCLEKYPKIYSFCRKQKVGHCSAFSVVEIVRAASRFPAFHHFDLQPSSMKTNAQGKVGRHRQYAGLLKPDGNGRMAHRTATAQFIIHDIIEAPFLGYQALRLSRNCCISFTMGQYYTNTVISLPIHTCRYVWIN